MMAGTRGLLLIGSLLLAILLLTGVHLSNAQSPTATSAASGRAAEYPVPDRYGLKGLRGFFVKVGNLPYDVESQGLTQQSLQRDVELQLRKGGALVLTREQGADNPNAPRLQVRINPSKTPRGSFYAYSILVTFDQAATLTRDNTIIVDASTWSKVGTGMVKTKKVDEIRAHALEIVDEFLNAYLAENPRS